MVSFMFTAAEVSEIENGEQRKMPSYIRNARHAEFKEQILYSLVLGLHNFLPIPFPHFPPDSENREERARSLLRL